MEGIHFFNFYKILFFKLNCISKACYQLSKSECDACRSLSSTCKEDYDLLQCEFMWENACPTTELCDSAGGNIIFLLLITKIIKCTLFRIL